MTAPSPLSALIERLEKASEPDRELDYVIAATLPHNAPYWAAWSRQQKHNLTPVFSDSIDAALTLIPTTAALSTERHWQVNSQRPGDFHAAVYGPAGWHHGTGLSPALAICIAALRARAALTSPGEQS